MFFSKKINRLAFDMKVLKCKMLALIDQTIQFPIQPSRYVIKRSSIDKIQVSLLLNIRTLFVYCHGNIDSSEEEQDDINFIFLVGFNCSHLQHFINAYSYIAGVKNHCLAAAG